MLVPAAQLNMSNMRASSLVLAAPVGNEAAWSMIVRPGAVRECGMLLLAQWSPCGGPPAEAHAEVFLQLPEPRAVRVSGVKVTGTAAQQAWAGAAGAVTSIPVVGAIAVGATTCPGSCAPVVVCISPVCTVGRTTST